MICTDFVMAVTLFDVVDNVNTLCKADDKFITKLLKGRQWNPTTLM